MDIGPIGTGTVGRALASGLSAADLRVHLGGTPVLDATNE